MFAVLLASLLSRNETKDTVAYLQIDATVITIVVHNLTQLC